MGLLYFTAGELSRVQVMCPVGLEFVVWKEVRTFFQAFSFYAVSSFLVPRIHPSPLDNRPVGRYSSQRRLISRQE